MEAAWDSEAKHQTSHWRSANGALRAHLTSGKNSSEACQKAVHRKEVSYMAAVENNRPDPMKAFKAIAMILNAREEGVKIRLTSVRKVEEDVRKAG